MVKKKKKSGTFLQDCNLFVQFSLKLIIIEAAYKMLTVLRNDFAILSQKMLQNETNKIT